MKYIKANIFGYGNDPIMIQKLGLDLVSLPAFLREGVLDPLVLLARSDDIQILREVARAINCVSSIEENKFEVANMAMSNIIFLVMYGDPEVCWCCMPLKCGMV